MSDTPLFFVDDHHLYADEPEPEPVDPFEAVTDAKQRLALEFARLAKIEAAVAQQAQTVSAAEARTAAARTALRDAAVAAKVEGRAAPDTAEARHATFDLEFETQLAKDLDRKLRETRLACGLAETDHSPDPPRSALQKAYDTALTAAARPLVPALENELLTMADAFAAKVSLYHRVSAIASLPRATTMQAIADAFAAHRVDPSSGFAPASHMGATAATEAELRALAAEQKGDAAT